MYRATEYLGGEYLGVMVVAPPPPPPEYGVDFGFEKM